MKVFGEICPANESGDHIYIDNICGCGKVIDIIEEDEEEYDEEGKICPHSKTGNHHFKSGSASCKYCGVLKSLRMTLRRSVLRAPKKEASFLNHTPLLLDDAKNKSNRSLFKNSDNSLIMIRIQGKSSDFTNKHEDGGNFYKQEKNTYVDKEDVDKKEESVNVIIQ